MNQELDAAYCHMAQDEAREAKALEWAEATIGDVSDEAGEVLSVNFDPTAPTSFFR